MRRAQRLIREAVLAAGTTAVLLALGAGGSLGAPGHESPRRSNVIYPVRSASPAPVVNATPPPTDT